MRKSVRVAIEILVPPAIAAAIFILLFAFSTGSIRLKGLLFVVGVAYVYAVLPSAAYAAAMEIAFSRGLSPRSWKSVSLSTVCGGGAGILIGAVFPQPSAADMKSALSMSLLGAGVGALTGISVMICSRKAKNA